MPTTDELDARLRTIETKFANAKPLLTFLNDLSDAQQYEHMRALGHNIVCELFENPDGTLIIRNFDNKDVLPL